MNEWVSESWSVLLSEGLNAKMDKRLKNYADPLQRTNAHFQIIHWLA